MTTAVFYLARAGFQAARRLINLSAGQPAQRQHGHGFCVRVRVAPPSNAAVSVATFNQALLEQLKQAVAPLDYQDLNQILSTPTDARLAHWLFTHLALPSTVAIDVASTTNQGSTFNASGQKHIWWRGYFEAAHRLPYVPANHPCGRWHGHSFTVTLRALQTNENEGYAALAHGWQSLYALLNEACLNELPGLENPTSEQLAAWIWQHLQSECVGLNRVSVRETASAGCHYDGTQYRIWKQQRFESALRLLQTPSSNSRLHGHSYRLRLHLTAPLDTVRGWTVDYGAVKTQFAPILAQLDHHCLNDLPDLVAADPAHLVDWIRATALPQLPELTRLDLQITAQQGIQLQWDTP